jgi:hypothetical protein
VWWGALTAAVIDRDLSSLFRAVAAALVIGLLCSASGSSRRPRWAWVMSGSPR